jgi:hypothetical protein
LKLTLPSFHVSFTFSHLVCMRIHCDCEDNRSSNLDRFTLSQAPPRLWKVVFGMPSLFMDGCAPHWHLYSWLDFVHIDSSRVSILSQSTMNLNIPLPQIVALQMGHSETLKRWV